MFTAWTHNIFFRWIPNVEQGFFVLLFILIDWRELAGLARKQNVIYRQMT